MDRKFFTSKQLKFVKTKIFGLRAKLRGEGKIAHAL